MHALQAFLGASRRNYAIAVAAVAVVIVIAVALTTGIFGGGSPKSFSAPAFIDAANGEGADLVLGSKLISSQKDVQIYGLSFKGGESTSGTPDDETAGASLTISPDSDAAIAVYDQCEATQSFICYRANNASLVFDHGTDPQALANVDSAVRALASN